MPDNLTICVCTRNRPEDLEAALQSIDAARPAVAAVVVADDSTDQRTASLVSQRHPHVDYVRGPRRGLGANRNAAISCVRTSHIAFIDDDARLNPEFVRIWRVALAGLPSQQSRIILTGAERKRGLLIQPKAQGFLGHQSRLYRPGEHLQTIVINATVFPMALFSEVCFDERLVYGSDEVDIAMRAVARGYRILSIPALVNDHFPSLLNRDYYEGHAEAARLYVTIRRYGGIDRSFLKTVIFAFVAPGHLLAHALKRRGPIGVAAAALTIGQVCRMLVCSRRQITARSTAHTSSTC